MSSNLNLKKLCAFCGREFIAHKTTTTCCSHRCSNLLYKQRKREAKVKSHDTQTDILIKEKPLEIIKTKPFLTITEAALYLGVSRPTLYSYLRNGELKAKRIGCKFKISRQEIDDLFQNLWKRRKDTAISGYMGAHPNGAKSASDEIEVKIVRLYDLQYTGCVSCMACNVRNSKYRLHCAHRDGATNALIETAQSDGIVFTSPVYFGDMTAQIRAFQKRLLFRGFHTMTGKHTRRSRFRSATSTR